MNVQEMECLWFLVSESRAITPCRVANNLQLMTAFAVVVLRLRLRLRLADGLCEEHVRLRSVNEDQAAELKPWVPTKSVPPDLYRSETRSRGVSWGSAAGS